MSYNTTRRASDAETISMNSIGIEIPETIQNINKCESNEENQNSYQDIWQELVKVRRTHPSQLICGYLNINSLAGKYEQIQDILRRNLVDMLFLAETKLDDSYPDAQFAVDNYTLWRADRNKHGGGVLAYLRTDVAGDRKPTLEFKDIESVGIEPKTLEMQMKRLMRTTQVSRQSEKILKIYKYCRGPKTKNNKVWDEII
ncbi:uncharacterized protein LOC134241404 [Saccostrea cucullata]|uniref:uncharacterized protein LOC134241404 n=1 Tax=Saccostrea cuccullata TaxID=36930 RepID=UPI002ED67C31